MKVIIERSDIIVNPGENLEGGVLVVLTGIVFSVVVVGLGVVVKGVDKVVEVIIMVCSHQTISSPSQDSPKTSFCPFLLISKNIEK